MLRCNNNGSAQPTALRVREAKLWQLKKCHRRVMASITEGLDKKKTRKRPGRKERRRRRQNTESNNKVAETLGDQNAESLGTVLAAAGSPVKFWFQQHSEDTVPDEICEYMSSILSDKNVTNDDIQSMVEQFLPSFVTKYSLAEQQGHISSLRESVKNRDEDTPDVAKDCTSATETRRFYDQSKREKITDNFLDLSKVGERKSWMRNRTIEEEQQGKWKVKKSYIKKQQQKDNKAVHADLVSHVSNFEDCNFSALNNGKGVQFSSDICIRLSAVEMRYDASRLLKESDVTLLTNHRYGLIGRNGCGKSTLLYWVEKLAKEHMSVLYVAQEAVGDSTNAIDTVLKSDKETVALIEREKDLWQKLEASNGADTSANTTDIENITDELRVVSIALEQRDASSARSRAAQILHGLSFTEEMQLAATSSLSGGWRMRLALASALFLQPSLLLLDEPTNHLDLHAVVWLGRYLKSWPSTLVCISHDSSFLNEVCTDIVELQNKILNFYKGNFETYKTTAADRYLHRKREYDRQQEDIAHKQQFVDKWINNKFGYNAGLVQSRLKELKKMREGGELHIEKPLAPGSMRTFKFPVPDKVGLANPIIKLVNVTFRYPAKTMENQRNDKQNQQNPLLFEDQSLQINLKSRICIVGPNGTGKSTLLKLIIGEKYGGLRPIDGCVVTKGKVKFAWFHQHFAEQIDLEKCPLEEMRDIMGVKATEQELRRRLGAFGISADLAVRSNKLLSGGQKARLAFAKLVYNNPHVLILDEPTNHLDIESIEAIGKGLRDFEGTVIFVSHDESFCRMVATEYWQCTKELGSITRLKIGFDEYKDAILNALNENEY